MTQPTRFQQIKDYAESKGGRASIGRLVIALPLRTGVVSASVQPEWDAPDVDGESRIGGTVGPYPVSMVVDDPEFQQLAAEINVSSLLTIEQHETTIAVQSNVIEALTDERDTLQQNFQAAQATIIQLDQQRAALALQVEQLQQQLEALSGAGEQL